MAADPGASLHPVAFADIDGWAEDDHGAAFAAFRRSAEAAVERPPKARPLGIDGDLLLPAAEAALSLHEPGPSQARAFFERWFDPLAVHPDDGGGFVTGYYEPEVDGSLEATPAFPVPLFARPAGLAEIGPGDDRSDIDPSITWAFRQRDGQLVACPDRAAIMAGALDGVAVPVAHVASHVEAFFIHVQGSARIRLPDGAVRRITFDGKSGHPYFPVARVLVERGLMAPAEATADVLRAWLLANPGEVPAVLGRNRSYIFFREAPVPDPALGPVAAAGVPLTPGRSLAVDRTLHSFHLPVFVDADIGGPHGFRRLMVAQDTGSAIVGPARGDLFFGTGDEAWRAAAVVRHPARFVVFRPRGTPRGA